MKGNKMPRGRPKGSKNLSKKTIEESKEKCVKIENISLTEEQQERKNKLNNILKEINKQGQKTGMIIDYANTIIPFERQLFGYKCLDRLSNGGIKKGQYSTIWGDPDCGKTTIAYKMIATAQKEGKIVVYINMEKGYDSIYAQKFGVNPEQLIIENCTTAEQALDTIIKLCSENVVDLIILDSIHGLSPKGEQFEGKTENIKSTEEDTRALLARKLSQFFRMSIPYVAKAKCAVLLIGQTRTRMERSYSIEDLSGGHALKHYSRLVLHIRRGQKVDAPTKRIPTGKLTEKGKPEMDNIQIGFDCSIKVDKSQIEGCKYLDEIHVPFISGEGIQE